VYGFTLQGAMPTIYHHRKGGRGCKLTTTPTSRFIHYLMHISRVWLIILIKSNTTWHTKRNNYISIFRFSSWDDCHVV